MLQLLVEYADKLCPKPEPGFTSKDVRWAVVCDAEGRFLDVVEVGDTSLKRNPGRTFPQCPNFTQPQMKTGGITKSHFLVDTAEVVALYDTHSDDPKVLAKHHYFVNLLRQAGNAMPELARLARCLGEPSSLEHIRIRLKAQKARPKDKLTFRIGNSFPLESDAWHDWWRGFRQMLASDKSARKSRKKERELPRRVRCFATGELVTPAATHDKVRGLAAVGGNTSGGALISFKQESFCSYGFVQSANAAVSEEGVSAYTAALNHLLREHSERLASAKVVHWFKQTIRPEDDPLAWLVQSEEQEELNTQRRARELLQSIRTGQRPDLRYNYFYALTLSGAGGRVMVRDWMKESFEELVHDISTWFDDLEVVRRDGNGSALPPKFLAVLGATVRDLRDLPAPFVAKMWRVAVRGEPIPQVALAQALERARVAIIQDQPLNHAGMGLLKAYHLRKTRTRKKGGENMTDVLKPSLNEEHPHPAYHCGRLMAVLAGLQRAALGANVGAGVVQRYYAAASSTPALVLGRLVRTAQFHLGKLQPGLAYWYEGKIAGILNRIRDQVPRTLNLEDQSLFALGYYQQMAALRPNKSETPNRGKEEGNV